jgi:outer membrane protein OmpA-like peptidoglycan-associated protein
MKYFLREISKYGVLAARVAVTSFVFGVALFLLVGCISGQGKITAAVPVTIVTSEAGEVHIDGNLVAHLEAGERHEQTIQTGTHRIEFRFDRGGRQRERVSVAQAIEVRFGQPSTRIVFDTERTGELFIDGTSHGTLELADERSARIVPQNGNQYHRIELRYPDGLSEIQIVPSNPNQTTQVSFQNGRESIMAFELGDAIIFRVYGVVFEPNSETLPMDMDTVSGRRNSKVIEDVIRIIEPYDRQSFLIVGHAVNISGTDREEREELLPLTMARAEVVRATLSAHGVRESRMSVIGRGGSNPVVPHSDIENRWRNRRIDIVFAGK